MALGFLAKGLLGAGKVVGKGVGLAGRGALMAGRAGMALRGRRRKINPAKLMGREDNVSGGKNVEKGGALMILPSGNLVAYSKGDISTKSRKPNEEVIYTIHEKVIEIDKFLKGTVAAEKIEQKKEQQKKEKERRAEREKKLEKPDKGDEDKETPKPLIPQIGFLEGIKQWITKVLVGWLVFNLIKFLPKIMGVLKWIGKIADFVFWLGGHLLNALVTMVHWGYKAFEWTRGAIGNVFGETGLKVFDGITGVLNSVLNYTMILAGAMIALSNELGTDLLNFGKNFLRLFKRGFGKRLLSRTLIQVFGKKTAATILTKLGLKTALTTTATTAATTTAAGGGTAATGGTAAALGSNPVGWVVSAGLAASGLGEGFFQLKKRAQQNEKKSYEKFKDKAWWNPMKYFWGAAHLGDKFNSYITGTIGVLLDIVGVPFRYALELIRAPFIGEEGRKKQRENLAKFDARIREHFREMVNAFSLGLLAKDKGAFGSLFGKKGTDAMGYTKDGKTKSQQADIEKTEKTEKTFEVKDGKVIGGTGTQKDYEKLKKIQRLEDEADFAAEQGDWKKYEQIQKQISILEGTKQKASIKPKPKGGGFLGGIKRAVGGFADFATLGMFDFDKKNRRGAPKGFGIKRIAGGLADVITAGATDFDKRGAGIGQMKLGEMMSNKKRREAYENNPYTQRFREKSNNLRFSEKGLKIADERFVPGQPLSEKQYAMIKYGISSGNQYPDEVMKSYKLYETEKNRVKGNSNNIMPIDVNSVSKKINGVSSNASYEDGAEQTVVIPSTSQEQSVNEPKAKEKLVPVAVGGGGGSSEIADALYMGG